VRQDAAASRGDVLQRFSQSQLLWEYLNTLNALGAWYAAFGT